MTSITQKLPPELLTEILIHATVPEILRSKQVNRILRDVVHASPSLQHQIDLFAVGLEHNAAAGISITDSRKALLQYHSNLDSLRPAEERMVETLRPRAARTASGVYAIIGDSLRLFVPGSISRGIPYKEWEIPLPVTTPKAYDFCPNADVVAIVEATEAATYLRVGIHLRALSDGSHHPAARYPTIYYTMSGTGPHVASVSITSSRLVLCAREDRDGSLVIWDWKTVEILFEEGEYYNAVEFIDNYRLLVSQLPRSVYDTPSLVLIDTEKVINGTPQRTFLRFPFRFYGERLDLLLERGAHEPSPAESMAPFHRDPSQRIVVFNLVHAPCYLVLKVASLLELLESHEGSEIGWDEWGNYAVTPTINLAGETLAWVSGCRLFVVGSANSDPLALEMVVYDFSMQGRSKYLIRAGPGLTSCLSPTGVKARIPWDVFLDADCGHDGIVFRHLSNSVAGDEHEVLHIRTF